MTNQFCGNNMVFDILYYICGMASIVAVLFWKHNIMQAPYVLM